MASLEPGSAGGPALPAAGDGGGGAGGKRATAWRLVGIALSVALLGAALFALHAILTEVSLSDVIAGIHGTAPGSIVASLLFVAGSYLMLTGYDLLALRHLGRRLSYATAALASFAGYTFSHTIGLSLLTGGSVRYRVYSAAGLSAVEVASVIGLCALTYGLGIAATLGLALCLEPETLGNAAFGLPAALIRALGIATLAALAGYVGWTAVRRRPLALGRWALVAPGVTLTLRQLALASVDITLAAAALYVLLPSGLPVGFAAFVGLYVAAMAAGLISHSPGGLGVFEAALLLMLPGESRGALLGALLLYRCLYYILPFVFALLLLATHELWLHRRTLPPASAGPPFGAKRTHRSIFRQSGPQFDAGKCDQSRLESADPIPSDRTAL